MKLQKGVIESRKDDRGEILARGAVIHKLATAAAVPGWGRPLFKLMNNCETDIGLRGWKSMLRCRAIEHLGRRREPKPDAANVGERERSPALYPPTAW